MDFNFFLFEKLRRKMSVSAIDVWKKVARIPSIKSAYFKNDLIFANLEISLVSFKKHILQLRPYDMAHIPLHIIGPKGG